MQGDVVVARLFKPQREAVGGPPRRIVLRPWPVPDPRLSPDTGWPRFFYTSSSARPSLCPTPSRALTEPLHFLYRGCVAPDRRRCDHGFLRWSWRT
jgi:hypothetical protein